MDLARDVLYRGFYLNNSHFTITSGGAVGTGIAGCILDSCDLSDVDVVQFTEKRSLQDGMDVGDVYLGGRRLRLAGTVYALTKNLLYDTLQQLRATCSPTLAFRSSPGDKGYLPLYYSVPTNRLTDYPSGTIDLMVRAMPKAFQATIQNDHLGSADAKALAITWQATFVMRDPRIMSAAARDYAFNAGGTHTDTGNLVNRGDYHAPLNMLVNVSNAAGTIAVTAGDSVFTITVPSSTGNRTVRYNGEDKILTITENSVEALRMDLLTFTAGKTHPLVPNGSSAYSVSFTGVVVQSNSHMWFWESYA
jgi:hypothetical protein